MPSTLRSCIIAEEGYTFISLDASQIELRVLAILSQDPQMLEDLKTGDLHLATAIHMFGWTDNEADMKSRRYKAKQSNFAEVYGANEFKLSEMLECTVEEALEFIAERHRIYPVLYQWIEATKVKAREDGFVVNIFGRIRPLPELSAGSWKMREKAERECVNTIIQGCLAPETRVLKSDLVWVPAGSLKVGDKLVAFEEYASRFSGRKWQEATVLTTGVIKLPCYMLTFSDGTMVMASEEHPWLTMRGKHYQHWLQTKDLIVNRSRINEAIPVWEADNSWEGGYLASAFDSEGSICQYKGGRSQGITIQYSQSDLGIQLKIEELLAHFGFDYYRYPTEGIVSPTSGVWQTRIKGGYAENLRFLGQIRPIRLLKKFNMEDTSRRMFSKLSRSRLLVDKYYLGLRDVIALETDTQTYFAEGMPSHNSAVDIVKKMMLYLRDILDPKIRLVLQIHDEIVWECPDSLLGQALVLCGELAQAFPDYPVAIKCGKIYGELKEVQNV